MIYDDVRIHPLVGLGKTYVQVGVFWDFQGGFATETLSKPTISDVKTVVFGGRKPSVFQHQIYLWYAMSYFNQHVIMACFKGIPISTKKPWYIYGCFQK